MGANQLSADEFAGKVAPIIYSLASEGLNLNQIAKGLNKANMLTTRGRADSLAPLCLNIDVASTDEGIDKIHTRSQGWCLAV